MQSFHRIDNRLKGNILAQCLFAMTDNLFIRPAWWDHLSEKEQSTLCDLSISASTRRPRNNKDLVDFGLRKIQSTVVNTQKG